MILSQEEQEKIFRLAEELIGTCQVGSFRKDILLSNIEKRIHKTGRKNLKNYLDFALSDSSERSHLISALTIHTTSWFRELPHWEKIQNFLLEKLNKNNFYHFRIWTAACSTGEEAYSIALILENLREQFLNMNYEIQASDIDSKSLEVGQKGIYSIEGLQFIKSEYQKYLKIGHGPAEGFFSIDKLIRQKIHFFSHNLVQTSETTPKDRFDIILCRNVLIYFDPEKVVTLVDLLSQKLNEKGLLILGHSEALARPPSFLIPQGGASYSRQTIVNIGSDLMSKKIQKLALVVDDSATIRILLKKILEKSNFRVVVCEDTQQANHEVDKTKFDLITLDLNVPGENGVQWLSRQRKNGLKSPVVIISESTPSEAEKIFGALEVGAQDYIVKADLHRDLDRVSDLFKSLGHTNELTGSNSAYTLNSFQRLSKAQWLEYQDPDVLLVGASTGGPEALGKLLERFPQPCPPIVVIQHIVTEFSLAFARRLSTQSGLPLGAIGENSPLKSGFLYVPDGDYHFELKNGKNGLYLSKSLEAKVCGHRPSVDFLFKSAAQLRVKASAVLLTGMGRDGAQGLLDLKQTGQCYTLIQDEKTSVVYGMPKVAYELGAAFFQGSPEMIRQELLRLIQRQAA